MIKLEKQDVIGWEHAIRGMRNPMNSWEKSDSEYCDGGDCKNCAVYTEIGDLCLCTQPFLVGSMDKNLMRKLRNAGTDHRKFMRMITVYVDITAPLYWWKEFDTYKVGTVANSCSTMHKIHEKKFEMSDFSTEHLQPASFKCLGFTVKTMNLWRDAYFLYDKLKSGEMPASKEAQDFIDEYSKKDIWWQMIQLLPSSYNQKRTVMLNYEVLTNMYKSRKNHKLDEWREFCKWVEETLPYSELITE
jgi:hypothetical protein